MDRDGGQDIVLVHGWGLDSRVWEMFCPHLAPMGRVITVDLPGYGRASELSDATGLKATATALERVVCREAVWVGWSFGGLVAIKVAAQCPACVKGLVLIASAPRFSEAPGWNVGMARPLLRAFATRLRQDKMVALRRFIHLAAHGGAKARFVIRYLMERLRDDIPNGATLIAGLEQLDIADLRDDLAQIRCPTLQLLGEKDGLLRHEVGLATRTLCKMIAVEVIRGAAHAPFISHRRETLRALRRFLNGLH